MALTNRQTAGIAAGTALLGLGLGIGLKGCKSDTKEYTTIEFEKGDYERKFRIEEKDEERLSAAMFDEQYNQSAGKMDHTLDERETYEFVRGMDEFSGDEQSKGTLTTQEVEFAEQSVSDVTREIILGRRIKRLEGLETRLRKDLSGEGIVGVVPAEYVQASFEGTLPEYIRNLVAGQSTEAAYTNAKQHRVQHRLQRNPQ